jgi:hypothetical protein
MNIIPRIHYPKILDQLEKTYGNEITANDLHLAIKMNFAVFNSDKISNHVHTMEQAGLIKRNPSGLGFIILKKVIE